MLQGATWSETFPTARIVELPAASAETLEIKNVHGSPDGYTGSSSDIGAHESGTPPMEFGVRAYLPASRTTK